MQNYATILAPSLMGHEVTSPLIGNYRILMPGAQGITISGSLRSGLSVTPLLSTSEKAISKVNGESATTTDFETGDIKGPFDLGVAISENNTRIIWFTSSQMLLDNINTFVAGANGDLFLNSLNWMSARENRIALNPKNYDENALSLSQDAINLTPLIVGIIPLAFLAAGIIIVVKRRRQ